MLYEVITCFSFAESFVMSTFLFSRITSYNVCYTKLLRQLPVFNKFESGEIEGFAENMEEYWGNILDYYQKMWDLIEDYSELIEGYSKTFDSMQANRTNEIVKILTLISSIRITSYNVCYTKLLRFDQYWFRSLLNR